MKKQICIILIIYVRINISIIAAVAVTEIVSSHQFPCRYVSSPSIH